MNSENNTDQQEGEEDPLAFLNNLPEVKKKPEPDVFSEHLAFLEGLKSTQPEPKSKATAVLDVPEEKPAAPEIPKNKKKPHSSAEKKTSAPKPKKKSNTQLQREEKNRIEREKAIAKKEQIVQQQHEAEERHKKEEQLELQQAEQNKNVLKKALSLIRSKPDAKKQRGKKKTR